MTFPYLLRHAGGLFSLAGGLGLSASALAQALAEGGKTVSTQSVGQPGKGEKRVDSSSTPSRNASSNAFPAWTRNRRV